MTLKKPILPSRKFRNRLIIFIGVSILIALFSYYLGFNPLFVFSETQYLRNIILEMFPPDFSGLWTSHIWIISILETLSMAFLGTVIGSGFSLILAFLCAENTMPWAGVRIGLLSFLGILRAIPALTLVLIFVISVGIGPFSGFLALLVTTVSTFARLFAETIENIDPEVSNSIYSVGGTQVQVIRFAILPQVLPNFIANFLFSFDVNIRTAVALGVLGGGGIGYQFDEAMRLLHYKQAMAIIIIIILMIIPMERVSDRERKKWMGKGLIL